MVTCIVQTFALWTSAMTFKLFVTKTCRLIFFIAFILYRKHHQANILAQNPGLTNPEISKLIGEQWKNTSPEVKKEWKALAEVSESEYLLQRPKD